ncbi:MAG: hypothetical protein EB036_14125 [Betaproteobacteria bacterium]|nr:hypothetical protein [Betaproteobacteria bacterium]NDE94496.1 hypothetical protein [Betaproteobacteria bacterium]
MLGHALAILCSRSLATSNGKRASGWRYRANLFAESSSNCSMLIRMVFLEPNITQSYKEAFDKLVPGRPEQ